MARLQTKVESRALWYGGAVVIVAAIVAAVRFWGQVVPLFGQESIGAVAAMLTAIAAFVGFLLSWRPPQQQWLRKVLTTAALAFTHAAIGLLLTVVTYFLLQSAFEGVRLDHWTAAALAGLTAGMGGYVCYLAGARMNSLRLATTLAVFMASGGLASMISSPNPFWWQIHFSSLGGGESSSAVAFNLTLVVGGLVIVGLADMIAMDFGRLKAVQARLSRVKVDTIRIVLAAMGVFLAGVGAFPYDAHLAMHNLAAGLMSLSFYALLLALPWLAPGFEKIFYGFSYALFGVSVACIWLYVGVKYLNLTTFELLTAGIIFAWVTVFVRHIAAGLIDAGALMAPATATSTKVQARRIETAVVSDR